MSSRAVRTAAMTEAAMTSVEANRSWRRRSSSSRLIALRISPMSAEVPFGFWRLAGEEQVGEPTAENFWGQVGAALVAQGAHGNNPSVGHGHDGGRDVLAASFAAHCVVADVGSR